MWAVALAAFLLAWYYAARSARQSDDSGAEPRTSGPASDPDAVHDPLRNPYGHQDP